VTQSSSQPAAATPDHVLTLLRQTVQPLDSDRVHLDDALHRTLAEPVRAPEDLPPFDRSTFDGFAIRIDDSASRFRVVDFLRAGDWRPRTLEPGQAVRIATGAALPSQGLQVVMIEDTRPDGDHVEILERDDDPNIRRRGTDAHQGQVLVQPGTILTHGVLALLASVGHARPLVTRLPGVLHLATGNEIVPPDRTPAPGEIRDSNSTLVRAFLDRWRIVPHQLRLPEELAATARALETAGKPDLLLISGGASVGEHDFTRHLLEQAGYKILVSRTTTRPGKPLIVARSPTTIAFGLPGNPLAHFVCLNLYVRAALDTLVHQPDPTAFLHGHLAAPLPADRNTRETFWPARCQLVDGSSRLTPLTWQSSGDLTPLARANALVRVPTRSEPIAIDAKVEFLLTEPLA
jgi:molybdopterin molybdotransferase